MTTIRDHILSRVKSDDPKLPMRVEFGIRAIAAVIQEVIRPPHRFANQMGLTNRDLADELTTLFYQYAGLSNLERN